MTPVCIVKKKLKKAAGFSLAELLVAVLILSMVSAVVAGGIPVARDAYMKVTVSANAQVMLSTAVSVLRNELSAAEDITVDGDGEWIEYYTESIRNYSKVCMGQATSDRPVEATLVRYSRNGTGALFYSLVSPQVGENKLHVVYESIAYDAAKGVITVTGLRVVEDDDEGNTRAKLKGDDPDGTDSILKIRVVVP